MAGRRRRIGRWAAEGGAWAAFALLFAGAVVLSAVLGFAGLALIGLGTWLVCVLAQLDDGVASWGEATLRARLRDGAPPPEPALRFFGRCGAALGLIGVAGLLWQALG